MKILKRIKCFLVDSLVQPQRLFLCLVLPFGLLMTFCMPLFQVPDEPVHFYRAYQVGEANLLSDTVDGKTGGFVRKITDTNHKLTPEQSPEEFVAFPTAALYSPIPYIPQALGIDFGRLVNPTIETMVIFGRLFNLIAYAALVYLAIRIAKLGKWVYVVVGLFPVAIQQAASLSTDVMNLGLVFIFIALIHNIFTSSKPIQKRSVYFIALLAAGLALTKQTNLVLLLTLLFLPSAVFGTRLQKIKNLVGIFTVALIAMCLWMLAIKLAHYNTDYGPAIGLPYSVQPLQQLQYIIVHPLDFMETLFRTFVFEGFKSPPTADFYLISMYGFFSSLTYKLPLAFIAAGYATLLLIMLNSGREIGEKVKKRALTQLAIIQTGVFLTAILAIAAALYMVWTPVGYHQISGIQGRYFIPFIPLLIPLAVLVSKYVGVSFDRPTRPGLLILGVSSVNMIASLLITYRWFY